MKNVFDMKKFQTTKLTRDRKIPSWSKEFKDWVLNEVNKAIEASTIEEAKYENTKRDST